MPDGETQNQQDELVAGPSKWQQVKSNAAIAAFYGGCIAIIGASTYYSFKVLKMNYETAELNLQVAQEALNQ